MTTKQTNTDDRIRVRNTREPESSSIEHREEPGGGEHTKLSDVTYRPPMDFYDLGDRYELHIELPGARAEEIDVTVHEGVLKIEATVPQRYEGDLVPLHREFGIGNYQRQIRLGEDIDGEGLTAGYRLGILTVELPKQQHRQPRRVEVRAD